MTELHKDPMGHGEPNKVQIQHSLSPKQGEDPFWNNLRNIFAVLGLIAIMIGTVVAGSAIYDGKFGGSEASYDGSNNATASDDLEGCNVYGINLHGGMYTYIPQNSDGSLEDYQDAVASEDITGMIASAEQSDGIKAILLEVDSGGGSPVAGEEVEKALKNAEKPTVAMIRATGASAAYRAATGADHIIASANSNVGSIGVTASYLDNIGNNTKEGHAYVDLVAGKYKDMGSPDRPLTKEERDLYTRDLDTIHQDFIRSVAENRGLTIEAVTKIADGSTVLGVLAKELGLIDEIGGMKETEDYLKATIGEDPAICWH